MKRILLVLLICIAGWKYWPEVQARISPHSPTVAALFSTSGLPTFEGKAFHCDGRQYCSQMTSCEEAKQFLRNCPGMKMDGDGNGVPCERQWCH
ncbi:excalibur calcium-binding domain-containing protein [Pseudomonas gingeri]|uniref:excalibur calcium-binding domain-containing protein n=1 Tax=Pseudomonas gingeri TaxID=117681 RepID=UPI0015BF5E71|nr:excalibur calcium-binding domain-containing protein [Pseudomonas gingeri]